MFQFFYIQKRFIFLHANTKTNSFFYTQCFGELCMVFWRNMHGVLVNTMHHAYFVFTSVRFWFLCAPVQYASMSTLSIECQKRPIIVSKETYYSVKRDLLQWILVHVRLCSMQVCEGFRVQDLGFRVSGLGFSCSTQVC